MLNKIIYFENEVPEVYVVESRDFQVLMRLLSIAFNACRVESQQLQFLNDAELINSRLIPLLQTKVGFFTKKEYSSSELRDICRIFMHIVRNKGSRKGIELAIRSFFSAKNFKSNYFIQIVNETSPEDLDEKYSIKIGLEKEFTDFKLLEDVLRYVLPTGYFLTIFLYNALDAEDTSLRYADSVEFARMVYEDGVRDDNALIQGSMITTTPGHHLSRIQTVDTTSVARAGIFRKENGQYEPTEDHDWPEEGK